MVVLKEVHAKNFRAWKELHLTDLDTLRLCLICGTNGSGKSSIRHIIEYCILDVVPDEVPLEDLPRDGDTECEMSILLKKDEDLIKITKYRNHKKYKNFIRVEVNGDDSLTKTDRGETQKEINALLEADNALLSTIFSQYSPSFAEAKDSGRKKVLYKYMSLDKYDTRHEKAKTICKDIEDKIESNDRDIDNLKTVNVTTEEEIKEYEHKSTIYQDEKRERIAKLLIDKEQLQILDTTILEDKLKELNKSIIEIHTQELLDSERILLNKAASVQAELSSAQQELSNGSNCICPIFKDSCDRLVRESEKVEETLLPKIKVLTAQLKKTKIRQERVKEELAEWDEKIQKNSTINTEIHSINLKLATVVAENKSTVQKGIDIDNRIKEISEEENSYVGMVERLKQKKKDTLIKIEKLESTNKELKDTYKYYKFWMVGYSKQGLPNMKIESMLGELEDKVNGYLSKLGGVSVRIKGQTELKSGRKNERMREKIDYKVISETGKVRSYHSYSAGEKHRVRVADMFAFSELMGRFNFILLDEVLEGSIDSKGKRDIVSLLKLKEKEGTTLLVISHDLEIQDEVDNVISIKKINGVSKII